MITASDIEVPKSGCSRISVKTRPAISPIGSSEYDRSSMRCIRRSSISAVKNTHAIFASSDGWMPRPPTPNHRRVPFTGALNSTATSIRTTSATRHQMNASLR